jgi:predicted glycosyltransferase
MRVWVDLANSPHVPLLVPVVRQLEREGHEVLLTARDHAQTLELARRQWPAVQALGGESPRGRLAKGAAITGRAQALRRFARRSGPTVAFSHGSYAQVVAARLAGVPAVTMMDYEHQPANHLSFRLATRVIVPQAFPESALRRFGARPRKVVRYPGFKEQLYLPDFAPDPGVLDELGLDPQRVIAVLRPPPEGALYHRMVNGRFDDLLDEAARDDRVQAVLLPRTREQAARYHSMDGVRIPSRVIEGPSLVALADLVIGAGGTMNRESAVLGTPTYTLFAGDLAAVDVELIRLGWMCDLRPAGSRPTFEKKPRRSAPGGAVHSEEILSVIMAALDSVSRSRLMAAADVSTRA